MRLRIFLAVTGIILVGLFFIFTLIVRTDVLRGIDFNMTVKIQDRLPQMSYKYLQFITEIAKFQIITILLVAVFLAGRQWFQTIVALGLWGGAHVLELVGKYMLNQPPPPFMFYKVPTDTWFPQDYVTEGNSYPSGHSMRAIFFAFIVTAFIFSSKKIPQAIKYGLTLSVAAFSILVGLGKVALGQHWTTDIIAGGFLGAGCALITIALCNLSFFKHNLQLKSSHSR
jgi:membrane-associated phospholipid phosphatase